MPCMVLLLHITPPQLFNVDRNKESRVNILTCQMPLLVVLVVICFPNISFLSSSYTILASMPKKKRGSLSSVLVSDFLHIITYNRISFICLSCAKGLNLGKKISVPKDLMMEELNLTSNRGSRMFQERQKRAEKFTLENSAAGPLSIDVRNSQA